MNLNFNMELRELSGKFNYTKVINMSNNKEESFDEIWDRNEILAKEISVFEDEYAFVLEQSQLYAMQNLAKETEDAIARGEQETLSDEVLEMTRKFSETMKEGNNLPVNRDTLKEQVTTMQNELDSRYAEQLLVCNKIVEYYEREKFSINWDDRNINFEMFPEYIEVVTKLRTAHAKSTRQTLVMLEKEPA